MRKQIKDKQINVINHFKETDKIKIKTEVNRKMSKIINKEFKKEERLFL